MTIYFYCLFFVLLSFLLAFGLLNFQAFDCPLTPIFPTQKAHMKIFHVLFLKHLTRIKLYYKRITKKLETLATRGFEYPPPPLHFLIFGCVQPCSIPQFPRLYLYYHYNVFFENFNPFFTKL